MQYTSASNHYDYFLLWKEGRKQASKQASKEASKPAFRRKESGGHFRCRKETFYQPTDKWKQL